MSHSLAADRVTSSKRDDDLSAESLELIAAFFEMTPDQRERVKAFVKEIVDRK